jgi:RND superfamily putative drug exporter
VLSLARWCSDHRRLVVAAWIVVLIAVLAAWQSAGSAYSNNFSLGDTGSLHAADLLKSRFPAQSGDRDQIVIRADRGVDDAAVRARITAMLARVSALPHVVQVTSPYTSEGRAQVSADHRSAFASVVFDERADLLALDAIK